MCTVIIDNNNKEQIDLAIDTISEIMDVINRLALDSLAIGQDIKADSLDNVNLYLNTAIGQLECIKEIEG